MCLIVSVCAHAISCLYDYFENVSSVLNSVSTIALQTYVSTDHVEKKLPAEELIRITKPITLATAKAVAAGNSGRQEDVIVAANMGRKAISDLLRTCKVSANMYITNEVIMRSHYLLKFFL